MVAVEDFGAIAGQKRGQTASHGPDDRFEPLGRGSHHGRRNRGFQTSDLVVKGGERGVNGDCVFLVGGVDGRTNATDDKAHQLDDRREEDLARVRFFGDVLEEVIENSRVESILEDGLSHDGDGIPLGKPLENLAVNRHNCLLTQLIAPWVEAV